ncbi:MAG: hypothetical protein DHS20C18_26680 [Saprospiraceae bacterium]|nr:MAG: hypothetical protein DHS20C18_26680 [Saprospiraceae bacterium]
MLLSILNYSCKKEDCHEIEENPFAWNFFGASALINGEHWEANRATYSYKQDGTIYISLDHNIWYANTLWAHRSSIFIKNLQPKLSESLELHYVSPGETSKPTAIVYTSTADGDAATGTFYLHTAENLQNWITISEINDELGEVVGSLEATFVKSGGLPVNNIFSDTIVVTNCDFRAKLIE